MFLIYDNYTYMSAMLEWRYEEINIIITIIIINTLKRHKKKQHRNRHIS